MTIIFNPNQPRLRRGKHKNMTKNSPYKPPYCNNRRVWHQTWMIMRLTAFLIIISTLSISAKSYSQKINLSLKDSPLATAFSQIRQQSGYSFLWTEQTLEGLPPVTVSVHKASLQEALEVCLRGLPLTYNIHGNVVYIERKLVPVLQISPVVTPFVPPLHEVTGVVKDSATRSPLAGVTIQVKGTTTGTTTDVDGKFSLQVPDNAAVLIVSFLGYERKEIRVRENSVVSIVLVPATTGLNQLIVVGYGTQKKSDLTGSISSIKGSEVTDLPTQRVDQALQGRAAGVSVVNTDGAPGGNTVIRIRGVNSVLGGNNALVVIDGLEGGDLSSLNPDDIASIEILKDASATAIYGSQGANGVILITTKTGKKGKPVIDYNYSIGFSNILKKLPLMNAVEYAKNVNAVQLSNDGNGIHPLPIFTDAQIQSFQKNGGTDWQDVIFRTAITQNHLISLSGATDKLSYRISGGYLDQEGIVLNSDYKRFSLRASVKGDITKWASFGLNWDGVKAESNSTLFGSGTDWPNNPISGALQFAPTVPVYDSNGNFSVASPHYGNPTVWNPLASAIEPVINNNINRNNVNADLDFTIIPGLTLKIMGGAILTNTNNRSFLNDKTFIGLQNNGLANVYGEQFQYYQNSNILTFDRTFSKHHLIFTALEEQDFTNDYSSTVNGSNFLNQQTGFYDLAGANIVTPSSDVSKRVLKSYMGRLNYVYDGKYLATVSFRADGSSVFGQNNKWGYFPSAALAWRVSQENFIRNLNFFSDLKLRASWGVTGNQAINPYETLARISSGANYPYDGGDVNNIGFYISNAPNPNLKWESTTQVDVGLDAGVLNNRLSLTVDYYNKRTDNLLMPAQLPTYTGLSSIIVNAGSLGNKGMEVSVSGDPIAEGNFKWHSGINVSANRTRVLSLGPNSMIGYKAGGSGAAVNSAFMYLVPGQPYGQMYGWKYLGVWKTTQAKEAAAYGQLPGDPHYFDKNHDGKITIADTTVIGNTQPKAVFGWSNELTYKNFNLTFLIQGTEGNDIFNVTKVDLDQPEGAGIDLLHRWTPQNQNSDIPGIINASTREAANLVNKISFPPSTSNTTSRYIENGSYARLKNVTMTYNFSQHLLQKIGFKNASVYLSGTNLITLTKYSGYDPEVSSYTANDAELGSDFFNYPSSKTWVLGLKISF